MFFLLFENPREDSIAVAGWNIYKYMDPLETYFHLNNGISIRKCGKHFIFKQMVCVSP